MLKFLWLMLLLAQNAYSLSYLANKNFSFDWVDIPQNSILHSRTYPYTGIGCSVYNNDTLYCGSQQINVSTFEEKLSNRNSYIVSYRNDVSYKNSDKYASRYVKHLINRYSDL